MRDAPNLLNRTLMMATACASLIVFSANVRADEWPDGVIDRSIQCDLFIDRVEFTVQIGMNDQTIQHVLESRTGDDETIAADGPQRYEQFARVVSDELQSGLSLKLDDQPIPLTLLSTEPSNRNRMVIRCDFSALIDSPDEAHTIELIDQAFIDYENQLRLAARGRGVELTRSNVPPLVVRTDRIPLHELSEEDAMLARTLRTSFQAEGITRTVVMQQTEDESTTPDSGQEIDDSDQSDPQGRIVSIDAPVESQEDTDVEEKEEDRSTLDTMIQFGLLTAGTMILIVGVYVMLRFRS